MFELLADAEERRDRVGLHAHADHDDLRAAAARRCRASSMMPGTPMASKTTSGWPPPTAAHASNAGSSAGSTTSWAPIVAASARRAGEKSAATIGSMPLQLQRGDDGEADRPAAEHERALARLDAATC